MVTPYKITLGDELRRLENEPFNKEIKDNI